MNTSQLPKTTEELQTLIEKQKQDAFLEGYRYAIQILSDGLSDKKIKQSEL